MKSDDHLEEYHKAFNLLYKRRIVQYERDLYRKKLHQLCKGYASHIIFPLTSVDSSGYIQLRIIAKMGNISYDLEHLLIEDIPQNIELIFKLKKLEKKIYRFSNRLDELTKDYIDAYKQCTEFFQTTLNITAAEWELVVNDYQLV